jgi:aspartyl-tRNA(Asn)/glutamyl-tRNA(Gln) amidotransferase subunit B
MEDQTLSSKTARTLFEALWQGEGQYEGRVDEQIDALGLVQMSDSGELERIIDEILATNPGQLAQLKAGKDKVLGFFVGQVMKATQGKANPQQVNELIRSKI